MNHRSLSIFALLWATAVGYVAGSAWGELGAGGFVAAIGLVFASLVISVVLAAVFGD